ncbi:MAG: hypothetical protein OQK12_05810, partial [Motiliproteus sp.]|nr:hypothetical protein [Motiliproteus sp.]
LLSELINAPNYLSESDAQRIAALNENVQHRLKALDELARNEQIKQWMQRFSSVERVEKLGRPETEELIREIQSPPHNLRDEEYIVLGPIEKALVFHLDQMSLDDIIQRIQQLPRDKQVAVYERLGRALNLEEV